MILNIAFLIGGLILLIGGGHFLVNAGVSAAYKFKIAPFIVGATVVAFGTSAPELLVSVNAAISGHPEMALGNVVGSNIANIALVLGATACILTLPVVSKRLFGDWLLVIISSFLLLIFSFNNVISTYEGIFLVAILLFYIYAAIKSPKEENEGETPTYSNWSVIALVFTLSIIGLTIGAHYLVEGASEIARYFNISERAISITVVALGTSLPELSTSVVAALKKQTDISIGNIIGSNLFNILAVIGITSIIKPIAIDFASFQKDLFIMIAIALLLMVFIYPYVANYKNYKTQKSLAAWRDLSQGKLTYIGGILFLLIYTFYIYSIFV